MALDTATLKNALHTALLNNIPDPTPEQNSEVSALAGTIADAISGFVLGLTITTLPTTGLVAPPGGGPVTGMLAYTLS